MAQFLLGTTDTEAFFRFGQLNSSAGSDQEDDDNPSRFSVSTVAKTDSSLSSNHPRHPAALSHSQSSLSSIAKAFRQRQKPSKKPPLTTTRPPPPPCSSVPQQLAPSSSSASCQSSFAISPHTASQQTAGQQSVAPVAAVLSPTNSLPFLPSSTRSLPSLSSPPVVMSALRGGWPEAKQHSSSCVSFEHDGRRRHGDGKVREACAGAGEEKMGIERERVRLELGRKKEKAKLEFEVVFFFFSGCISLYFFSLSNEDKTWFEIIKVGFVFSKTLTNRSI